MQWLKQSGEPLFPDIEWSKPQNKQTSGKLLIVGGSLHGFSAPAEAYSEAEKAGIGHIRILLPQELKSTLLSLQGSALYENCEFAPSTPSGSFSKMALQPMLELSNWADGVLLAGDLDRNSETAVLLESYLEKYSGQLTLTKDGLDYFVKKPQSVLKRKDTLQVGSFAQISQVLIQSRNKDPLKYQSQLMQIVENLSNFSSEHNVKIITKHQNQIIVTDNGAISTTKTDDEPDMWRVKVAAKASVYWLQNPDKPFDAITTAVFENNKTD